MLYKEFKGLRLSALGLGTMRLPVTDGDPSHIDEDKTADMIAYALQNGINYFDTAYGYHGGNSERVVGKLLEKYPRGSFYLASKFPGYDLSVISRVEEIFEEQLAKCRVDHFDFYMFHNVCELNVESYLDPQYGVLPYLLEQKKNGRIRHLGFSAHGGMPVLQRFLDACGEHMEFCQLQINYVDWTFQGAKEKVALMEKNGIPVWVMEPLRGGKLASLAPSYEDALKALRPNETVPAWAFRFIQSLPQVGVTLSGMSDFEQLRDNIKTFSEDRPLSPAEFDRLTGIAADMLKHTVPCTACRYCVDHCPAGLDIPHLLSLYNEHAFTGGGFLAPMALRALPRDKWPDACVACRACESVCPQNIPVPDLFKDFSGRLR